MPFRRIALIGAVRVGDYLGLSAELRNLVTNQEDAIVVISAVIVGHVPSDIR